MFFIKQELPINRQIRAKEVQLIAETGEKLGVVALNVAIEKAEEKKELPRTYHLSKKYNDAIKLYDELLVVDKNDYNVLFNKAIALHALGSYESAIEIYKNLYAQRTEPKVREYLSKAYIAQGDVFMKNGQQKKALNCYQEAASVNLNDPSAYKSLAQVYDNMGSKNKALEQYEKALEINPDDKDTVVELSLIHI